MFQTFILMSAATVVTALKYVSNKVI